MISFDTNVLLYSVNRDCEEYEPAKAFFHSLPVGPGKVAICELVLIELYVLLRNPLIFPSPLKPEEAVSIVESYRHNPTWVLLDYPGNRSSIMDDIWLLATRKDAGRRVIFDARLALTLRYYGVTEFATRNEKHFLNFGFKRVWDPINVP